MIGRTPMVRRQPPAPSLPAGEVVLWQGAPSFRSLVRRALHLRTLGIYFAVLVAWNGIAAFLAGESAAAAGLTVLLATASETAIARRAVSPTAAADGWAWKAATPFQATRAAK